MTKRERVIAAVTHRQPDRVPWTLGLTSAALEGVAAKVAGVLQDPPPQIFLHQLGPSAVDWQVRLWCKTEKYWDVHQAAVRATKQALDSAGISFPCPQMDVHLDPAVASALGGRRVV